MAANGKKRTNEPTAGEVVREIHNRLAKRDANGESLVMVRRFELAMQNRFRGPEEDVRSRLSVHLAEIQRLNPPQKPWIDLGCGRGEWIEIASRAGANVMGVDRNEFAIEQCLNRNLHVVYSDALDYLRDLPDGSCAVLTAFHLIENCEFNYTLRLLREAVRVLASSGVFALETPNPGNHQVMSYQFWLDPMHLRPLPQELMEFTFEHLGLQVVRSSGLNPHSQYGPQDYSLVAVR